MASAQQNFDALNSIQRGSLATRVFEILEYDEDGNPGSEWSSDTLQGLGDLFAHFGINFTDPGA